METLYAQSSQGDQGDGLGIALLGVMALVGLIWLAILIFTAVSIIRSDRYSTAGKTGWVMGILGFPFIPLLSVLLWHFWAKGEGGAPKVDVPAPGYPPQPHSGMAYEPQPEDPIAPPQ